MKRERDEGDATSAPLEAGPNVGVVSKINYLPKNNFLLLNIIVKE